MLSKLKMKWMSAGLALASVFLVGCGSLDDMVVPLSMDAGVEARRLPVAPSPVELRDLILESLKENSEKVFHLLDDVEDVMEYHNLNLEQPLNNVGRGGVNVDALNRHNDAFRDDLQDLIDDLADVVRGFREVHHKPELDGAVLKDHVAKVIDALTNGLTHRHEGVQNLLSQALILSQNFDLQLQNTRTQLPVAQAQQAVRAMKDKLEDVQFELMDGDLPWRWFDWSFVHQLLEHFNFTYKCRGKYATIIGTNGPDNLLGTVGDDVVVGLGGDDMISTGDGNDYLCGGPGVDVLIGSNGNDVMDGDEGNDDLFGGPGINIMHGGEGNDFIRGNDDQDFMYGNEGNDILRGGGGNDHLDGDSGSDVMWGDAGDDTLVGEFGNDQMTGGTGTDTCDGGQGTDQFTSDCETPLNTEQVATDTQFWPSNHTDN